MESNPKLFYANIDNVTCSTNELIENVVSKCDLLFSVEDILEKLSVWKVDNAHEMYSCLCNVFPHLSKPKSVGDINMLLSHTVYVLGYINVNVHSNLQGRVVRNWVKITHG